MKFLALLSLLLVSGNAWSANISTPYTFSTGQIRASELNANFAEIAGKYNAHQQDSDAHNTFLATILGNSNSCGTYDIDFNLNQALSMRLENLTSNPTCSSSRKGQMIYNSTAGAFYGCDGTNWLTVVSGSTPNIASVLANGSNAGGASVSNLVIDADTNTLSNIDNADIKASAAIAVDKLAATTASRALVSDASGFLSASATTSTQIGYLSTLSSNVQTQINSKEASIGNPASDGYVLSSTAAGVRSWVDPSAVGSNSFATIDADGTSVVAASPTSTLSLSTDGTLLITGNNTSKDIELDVNAGSITDTHISSSANISRSKIAASGSGLYGYVLINNATTGKLDSEAQLAISRGGTGQATASTAFAALSPLTTKGDLLAYGTGNARLPVGSDTQCLIADSAQALGIKWGSCSGSSGNSFETISVPSGTSPVADSLTDTLNLTTSDSTIVATGTSATDTLDLKVGSNLSNANISSSAAIARTKLGNPAYASKSADYTLTSSDDTVSFDTSSASKTATLPAAASNTGKVFTIQKSSNSNLLTIDGNGSETIAGSTTYVLVGKGAYATIQSDGSNWIILAIYNPWKVDANISGANATMGSADVSSYASIESTSFTLTNNSGIGNLTAQIPCSTTNAPSGTTCSSGNESIGVAFSLPNPGDVMACVSFIHSVSNSSSAVDAVFQIVETPTNAQTISQEGKSRTGSFLSTTTLTVSFPYRLCGVFTFSTSGSKALRLFYEQDVTGTPASNLILGDASASLGQRDIHWEVYPITQ